MRILPLNIQSGGGEWDKPGSRARRLYDYLVAADADILILSEYQEGTSATLVAHLSDAGSPHTTTPTVGSRAVRSLCSRDYRYREFWAGLNAELTRAIDAPWLQARPTCGGATTRHPPRSAPGSAATAGTSRTDLTNSTFMLLSELREESP